MKIVPTGFTRRLDDLGRIVIPKEVRRKMFESNINQYGNYGDGAVFEIFLVENGVYLKRREDLDNES
jgi:bifunctional DNA-binding transcriptional regulator/antitoxin component of YhaV-PrlF toxin-antitoxin module